jgi:peptide/nickel transport system ATP-binding protein
LSNVSVRHFILIGRAIFYFICQEIALSVEGDNTLLEVSGLTISISGHEVVSGVDWKVERGTTTAIVGESGSGKTLSALAVLGLLPPQAQIKGGCIQFKDGTQTYELTRLNSCEWRGVRGKKISMIFQEPAAALNPVFTVGRQTVEIIAAHEKVSRRVAYGRILDLYAEMGLDDPEKIFRSYPHQLSGGQKQRAMIAMAVAAGPALLLADEPTTALDPGVRQKVMTLLAELQRTRGLSIVFISHDLALVKQIARNVVVMRMGRVVEAGTCESVLGNPRHAYTRALLDCRPRLGYYPRRLPTVEGVHSHAIFPKRSPSAHPLLQIQNLHVDYKTGSGKTFGAVRDVSFEIFDGETLGLAGESGSGKSSIGKALIRLTPARGRVVFHDGPTSVELTRLSDGGFRPYRKRLQIIFQDPYGSLNPLMTVGQTIVEPMRIHGLHENDKIRNEKAAELLEKVGMHAELLNRYPHALSGGQRQRVAIARALATSPKFIVCDECVSALDVSVQAAVLNLLNDLKDEFGLTYLFISHDLAVLRYMCERILVMKSGQIVEAGTSERIVSAPTHPYTRSLVSAAGLD